jgi:hypothetical protein
MNEVTEPFVHVLLFECSNCSCPIPSAITSHNKSMEHVDSRVIAVSCGCGWSGQVMGTDAKRHWVDEWPVAY